MPELAVVVPRADKPDQAAVPRSCGLPHIEPAGDQRHGLRDPAWAASGRARPRLSTRDALQALRSLEPPRRVLVHFVTLAAEGSALARLMIDITYLQARCTAASLLQKGILDTSAAPKEG